MSTSTAALKEVPRAPSKTRARRLDVSMFAGIAVALVATVAGIAVTGVSAAYFLQPTGALIVVGGTLGVIILTTPRMALIHSARRVARLLWESDTDRYALRQEIMGYVKRARAVGLISIEPLIEQASTPFLRESLILTLDVQPRDKLKSALEMKLRLRERQGEGDAKVLEVAGGFTPTIGVLGTIVGLIDVLRQFSNLQSVAAGVGTAFVSTIYGLALANLVLLPMAHRIRARVAEAFETHEMIMEGMLCIFDKMHPSLVEERLNFFLLESETK
ncbi:MAG TPA: MotA/TolQ/ExbB proton channel family protein [Bryobacteraceae bacterium]|nr:MotA/TolQ/ExbB proton channel family protein [Bryobacteraceae bacterium]